jgi:hypothetical protein
MTTKRRVPVVDTSRSEKHDGLKDPETVTAAMASAIDVGEAQGVHRPERRFNPDLVEESFLFHCVSANVKVLFTE